MTLVQMSFLITLAGTAGSLVFSEVLGYPPCTLCWYQRICLYPLIVIYGAAIWTGDAGYKKYAYPLVAIGFLLGVYHNLLYYGIVTQPLVACTKEVSCSAKQLELFGFITIPLLALASFAVLLVLMWLDKAASSRQTH
ncbi:MAG TPA: disulfide bond formation protein B [Bdellovibrionales bacterium]|nr:disulfide bond formation protein B [Bdellovibrionales bacterium]